MLILKLKHHHFTTINLSKRTFSLILMVLLGSWEVVVSSSGVQYAPFPVPEQGLPAKFWKESSANMRGQD